MSDDPKVTAGFGPMVMTGLASSTIGDKVGDALADVVTWLVQLACHCAPPVQVTSAFHTLFVALTVGLAFVIHYQFIKPKGDVA